MTIRLAVPAYFHPERDARTWARLAGRAPAVGLVDEFDFAVDESCVQYRECAGLQPFTAQGKPVLHAEYDLSTAKFCPVTAPLGFRSIRKPVALTAPVEQCPAS